MTASDREPRIVLSDADRLTFRWYRAASVLGFYVALFADAAMPIQGAATFLAVLAPVSAATAFCLIDGILYGRYYERSRLWLIFYFSYVALPLHVLLTRGWRGAAWGAVHLLASLLTAVLGGFVGGHFG